MPKGTPHPRLLNEVMEAIAKLKEQDGSTPKKISSLVEAILAKKRTQLQRNAGHITRALKHGVLTGLITRSKGRYKLGMAKRDYDVFKNLTPMARDGEVFREHKRRGKRRSRKRRRSRRGRRRRNDFEVDTDDNCSEISADTMSSMGTPVPEDKGRRRRRRSKGKGRRRRRRSGKRGRRGRKHGGEEDMKTPEKTSSEDKKQHKKVGEKSSNDSLKSSGSQPQFNRNQNGTGHDGDENLEDLQDVGSNVNCDSPDCLCNVMQSEENSHDNRKTK